MSYASEDETTHNSIKKTTETRYLISFSLPDHTKANIAQMKQPTAQFLFEVFMHQMDIKHMQLRRRSLADLWLLLVVSRYFAINKAKKKATDIEFREIVDSMLHPWTALKDTKLVLDLYRMDVNSNDVLFAESEIDYAATNLPLG